MGMGRGMGRGGAVAVAEAAGVWDAEWDVVEAEGQGHGTRQHARRLASWPDAPDQANNRSPTPIKKLDVLKAQAHALEAQLAALNERIGQIGQGETDPAA